MLLPKRVKYRRVQRGRRKGVATRGNTVSNGQFGLHKVQPDRGGSYRYDTLHQAWRSGLDQDIPG